MGYHWLIWPITSHFRKSVWDQAAIQSRPSECDQEAAWVPRCWLVHGGAQRRVSGRGSARCIQLSTGKGTDWKHTQIVHLIWKKPVHLPFKAVGWVSPGAVRRRRLWWRGAATQGNGGRGGWGRRWGGTRGGGAPAIRYHLNTFRETHWEHTKNPEFRNCCVHSILSKILNKNQKT